MGVIRPVECGRSDGTFSVDQAMEYFGHGKFQLLISGFAGFIMMADAMEMMILSILSPALACEWGITEMQQAFITTAVFAGMAMSSGVWGWFCDRHGRRTGLMIMSLMTFLFATASAFSPNYYVFVVLRMITGVCIGGMPQSTTYYSEFLPVAYRAQCILLFYVFWSLGGAFEAIVALLIMEPLGWRWLLVISTLPLLLAVIFCWFVPETPRFSIASGKPDEAYETLKLIGRLNGRELLPNATLETAGGASPKPTEKEDLGRFGDLFSRKMALTTILVWFIWFASTFCYYGLILLTTVIFQNDSNGGGNSHSSANNQTLTSQASNVTSVSIACKNSLKQEDYFSLAYTSLSEFPGLVLCALMFHFLGRKLTMSIEFGIFGAFTLALLFFPSRSVTTALIFVARAAINGVFSSVFIYTPEVYPTTMRAVGMGSASAFGRLGALLTPFSAEVVSHYSIFTSICIYGGAGILAAIAPLLLPIETNGRRMMDRLCDEGDSTEGLDITD